MALKAIPSITEVLEAGSLLMAKSAIQAQPDLALILLDLQLPDSDGIGTLKSIQSWIDDAELDVRIIVLSASAIPSLVREVIENYGTGFILKATPTAVFTQAVSLTLAGGVFIPDVILNHLGLGLRAPAATLSSSTKLTARESEVAALLIRGFTYKRIARELERLDGRAVSEHTVRAHVGNIAWKLGVTENAKSGVMAEIARRGLTFPSLHG